MREPGGFRLPNPVNEHRFPTPAGKAVFTRNIFERIRPPEGHLVLQTMRSHDQWNTVPYALDDRYRGIHNGRRVVLVNPDDIHDLGLVDRQSSTSLARGMTVSSGVPRVSGWSHIRPLAAPPQSCFPRLTCSCRWTASPR